MKFVPKEGMQPEWDLLIRAYDIVMSKEDNQVDLNNWAKDVIGCGTIACAAGWLGFDPVFQAKGIKTVFREYVFTATPLHGHGDYHLGNIHFVDQDDFWMLGDYGNLARLFNIPHDDAQDLFIYRVLDEGDENYEDPALRDLTDKQLFDLRMRNLFAKYGKELKAAQ